jgi:nucleotide-binding universal stress UspA family protein
MQSSTAAVKPDSFSRILARVFADRSRSRGPVKLSRSHQPAEPEVICLPRHSGEDAANPGQSRRSDILVPMDFSPASFQAADYAIAVARRTGARVLLLHAVHLNLTPYGPANPLWLRVALCREALEKMEATMARAQDVGVSAISVIEEGSPAEVITAVAKRWKIDLLVLASHKRNWLERFFGRHISQKVMHSAECPIVFVELNRKHQVAA